MKHYSYILFFLILFQPDTIAQTTKVRGFIYDSLTKEPVPYAAVAFQGTSTGTISSFSGEYFLETSMASDSLEFSCMGYKPQKLAIKPYAYQEIDVYFEPDNFSLDEVTVTPGENPAHVLLRKIQEKKKINHPDNIPSYSCEIYNKIQVDLNNFGDKLKDRKIMNQFDFVFNYVDTSTLSGKEYLPVFFTETVSDYYYRDKPKKEVEVIKASKVSGIENESLAEYTGKMYQSIEIYDNFISVVEPGFVSPISDFGLMYYKYYIIDTMNIDNHYCYQVSFKPKRKQERTFSGYFIVADTSYAIVEAQLRLTKDANINFINDYLVTLNFETVDDSVYFLTKEKHIVDLNLDDKTFGFFGNKTTFYRNISLNPQFPEEVEKARVNIVVADGAIDKNEDYWLANRQEELTSKELAVYEMVDSIKDVPLFKHTSDLVELLTGYYYIIGPFEYGPYYTTFSNNYIEGNRVRIGGRTSNAFSTKLMLSGDVAYGFEDEIFKYGVGAMYMFNKNPRRSMGLYYEYDRRQLGQTDNAFRTDNIMTSLLRRSPNKTLTLVEEYKGFYEHEWFQGLSNTLNFTYQNMFPLEAVPFSTGDSVSGMQHFPRLTNAEISLYTRIAKEEKFLMGEFVRTSLGSEYPILEIRLSLGIKGLLGSDYNYSKLKFNVSDKIETNPIGYFKYNLEAGKIFGTLPYPLLQLHSGNETYAYDFWAFNMMNYYEFVSDTYFSWITEHHFQGFFLNRIPLIRKLGWREIASMRGAIGSLSDNNKNYWNFPDGLSGLSKPYMEAGVGVENIFKFFRLDALWRLSYLDQPNIQKFGLRLGMQVIL